MRLPRWSILLVPCVLACAGARDGTDGVRGGEVPGDGDGDSVNPPGGVGFGDGDGDDGGNTPQVVLMNDPGPYCERVCASSATCNTPCICEADVCECFDVDVAECAADCSEAVPALAAQSELCAELLWDLIQCFEANPCAAAQGDLCNQSELVALCPLGGNTVEPTPMPGPAPMPAPVPEPVPAPAPMPAPPPDGVVCSGSIGGGPAPSPDGVAGPQVTCDATFLQCSDGHQYRSTCVTTNNNTYCSCILDGVVQGSFAATQMACPPSTQQFNEGCGWNFAF